MHCVCCVQDSAFRMPNLSRYQKIWNDTDNLTVGVQGSICRQTHQTHSAAAEYETDPVRGEERSEFRCGRSVALAGVGGGTAVQAYGFRFWHKRFLCVVCADILINGKFSNETVINYSVSQQVVRG